MLKNQEPKVLIFNTFNSWFLELLEFTMSLSFSLTQTLHRPFRGVDFLSIAQGVLSTDYELSVLLIGDVRMRSLNRTYRNKDYSTNVLAFPLSKKSGEVIINVRKAAREARCFGHTPREHVAFLFIHGLLHLKGHAHGSRMESEEQRLMQRCKSAWGA